MENRGVLIDTSFFIQHLRSSKKAETPLYNLPESLKLYTSSVTIYELLAGANNEAKRALISMTLEEVEILPFDEVTASEAAKIFQELKLKNKLIEFRDIFIAATALVHNLPVASLNVKHFERIEALQLY